MTLEEKREKVMGYCERTSCGECVLQVGGWKSSTRAGDCLVIRESPEADLDRALAIINGECECPTCRYYDSQYDDTECKGCKNGMTRYDPGYETAPIKWTPATDDPAPSEDDPVNHPTHYTSGGIECLDALEASMTPIEYAGFLKGQVFKYIWRYRLKGKPVQDLRKALFYLDRLIKVAEKEEAT